LEIPLSRAKNRRKKAWLKSDLGGIEMDNFTMLREAMTALKSDLGGIEMVQIREGHCTGSCVKIRPWRD